MGETVTGGAPLQVPIVLPGGASGETVWPIRGLKFPHATTFLDPQYFKGYPNPAHGGRPDYPELVGQRHTGTDMNGPGSCNADQGVSLHAVREGVIEWVGVGSGRWGLIIILRVAAEGRVWWVRYAHVQVKGATGTTTTVTAGQRVTVREVIGYIGRGTVARPWPCAHLHIDVFHTRPPAWDWWPRTNAAPSEVTAYCTDPDAWLRRLKAVAA